MFFLAIYIFKTQKYLFLIIWKINANSPFKFDFFWIVMSFFLNVKNNVLRALNIKDMKMPKDVIFGNMYDNFPFAFFLLFFFLLLRNIWKEWYLHKLSKYFKLFFTKKNQTFLFRRLWALFFIYFVFFYFYFGFNLAVFVYKKAHF